MIRNENSGLLPKIRNIGNSFTLKALRRLNERDKVGIRKEVSPDRIVRAGLTERFRNAEGRGRVKSSSPLLNVLIESSYESIRKSVNRAPFHVVGKKYAAKMLTVPRILLEKPPNPVCAPRNLTLESKLTHANITIKERKPEKRYTKHLTSKNIFRTKIIKRSDSDVSIRAWD